MAKLKCVKDIYLEDTLLAAEGDEVEIIGSRLINETRDLKMTHEASYFWSLVDSGKLVPIQDSLEEESDSQNDSVNHPVHYTSHPSGVECIDITRHYCFPIGNAIKYLWRAGLKQDADKTSREKEIEDLRKAIWYIKDRIKFLKHG